VTERILHRVASADGGGKHVTVSIGVAAYPEHGVQVESLIQAADDAMYLAKRRGKNRVVVAGR
jgi:diguanylate cyclase (GGDEF)-like protein